MIHIIFKLISLYIICRLFILAVLIRDHIPIYIYHIYRGQKTISLATLAGIFLMRSLRPHIQVTYIEFQVASQTNIKVPAGGDNFQ